MSLYKRLKEATEKSQVMKLLHTFYSSVKTIIKDFDFYFKNLVSYKDFNNSLNNFCGKELNYLNSEYTSAR